MRKVGSASRGIRKCLLLVALLLSFPLFARTIQEEPLFMEFLSMDYGTYETESDCAFVLEDHPEYQKASLTYGKEYVEYSLEKEGHEMLFFLTEEGSIYSLDGLVLDITKPSLENQLFAQYLEEFQTLLRDSQDLFRPEMTTVYQGKGSLEEVPLRWRITVRLTEETAYMTYSYTFLQGSTFTYSGTIPRKELQDRKDLVKAALSESFELN